MSIRLLLVFASRIAPNATNNDRRHGIFVANKLGTRSCCTSLVPRLLRGCARRPSKGLAGVPSESFGANQSHTLIRDKVVADSRFKLTPGESANPICCFFAFSHRSKNNRKTLNFSKKTQTTTSNRPSFDASFLLSRDSSRLTAFSISLQFRTATLLFGIDQHYPHHAYHVKHSNRTRKSILAEHNPHEATQGKHPLLWRKSS